MQEWVLEIMWGGLALVITYYQATGKKAQKKAEERALTRQKESYLSMRMAFTMSKLSDVTAHAVSGGHTNGNMAEARKEAQAARDEYEEFMMNEACRQTTKI